MIPEVLPPTRSADSLHDLLLDLLAKVRSEDEGSGFVARAFGFVGYCLDPSRAPSVRIDAIDGFVRHAVVDPALRRHVADQLFRSSTTVHDLLVDRMPPEDLAPFEEMTRSDPRWGGFERDWSSLMASAEARSNSSPGPELRPLLKLLQDSFDTATPDPCQVRAALISLLEYLTMPKGRTDANCWAVDQYLTVKEDFSHVGGALPNPYVDILEDMAGALHDAVSAPEVASSLAGTPEQLLARAMLLEC